MCVSGRKKNTTNLKLIGLLLTYKINVSRDIEPDRREMPWKKIEVMKIKILLEDNQRFTV